MTDYYVNATSGSDSNPGTEDAPYATISQASSVASAGTIVHVAPGVYDEEITTTADGTADAPITFVSDVQGQAIIVPPENGETGTAWWVAGDYITVDGFEIDGADYQEGRVWNTGICLTGSYDTASDALVHNIALSDLGDGDHGAGGIVSDSYYGGAHNDVVNSVVHDVGYDSYDQGIYMSTSGAVLNNEVYNIASVGIHLWHNATNVDIGNNAAFNCGSGILVGGGDYYNGFEGPDDYTNVFNNLVYANDYAGIEEEGYTGTHNTYINNDVYDNGYYDYNLQNGNTYSNSVAVDMQSVNYIAGSSNGDYHSPAIVGNSADDIEGSVWGEATASLVGINGETDIFVFAPGIGENAIFDFSQIDGDKIGVSAYDFTSINDLRITSDGHDTVVHLNSTDTVTLIGFADQLTSADFVFQNRS